jgi:hypothetical protein
VALASQPISLPARKTSRLLTPAKYWHLLSLDAPTVAALWAWSLARALDRTVPPAALAILFAGTWLLYVADRILDGLHQPAPRLRERHFFYIRNRAAAIAAAIPVAALLTWLIIARMLPAARLADLVIFAIACAYFALVHLPRHTLCRAIERWFPKELIVALVFASATAVPAFARIPLHLTSGKSTLAILALLFAALCWLNCIAIEKWELNPASPPATNNVARCAQQHLRAVSVALVSTALCAGAFFLHGANTPAAALSLAAAVSATLLLLLDRHPLSALRLRIAADAALLTPLLLLFIR